MSGEKNLLVDASEKVVAQLSGALEKMGYQVQTVQWAEEALTIAQEGEVDGILLRKNLPGMSAVQFLQDIRRKPANRIRPIILVYGKHDKTIAINVLKSGADDFIALPFSMPELLLRLDLRLRKTVLSGENVKDPLISTDIRREIEMPSPPAPQGTLASRSVPRLMATIFLRNDSGVLRIIQKKAVRTFYFDRGFLRAASSTAKSENLGNLLQKWKVLTGEARKKFRSWGKLHSDRMIMDTAMKITALEPNQVTGLAARAIQHILRKTLALKSGDYDWVDGERPGDLLIMDARGLNPAVATISALRNLWFKPVYKEFEPKNFDWIIPNSRQGVLRDVYMLTPEETAAAALTENGISYSDFIRDARRLLPYADALLHILLSFRGLQIVEKRATSPDEIRCVAYEKTEAHMPDIGGDFVADDGETPILEGMSPPEKPAVKKVKPAAKPTSSKPAKAAKPAAPRPATAAKPGTAKPAKPASSKPAKAATATPRSDPAAAASATARPAAARPAKARAEQPGTPKVNASPVGAAETVVRPVETPAKAPQQPARKVRELYPDAPEEKGLPQKAIGAHAFGFRDGNLAEGSIGKTPAVFLFALATNSSKTGTLVIQGDVYEYKLFFKKGRLLFARSNDPQLRVDQIMVDMGMINAEQKSQVEKMISEMGKMRSGTLIFQHQLVNMMQLSDAIHRQINMIITTIFSLKTGTYVFHEGSLPEEEHIPFDVPGSSLLVSCIREMTDFEILESHFPNMNDVFVQTESGRDLLNRYRLGSQVAAVVEKFRKPVPIKEAVAGSKLGLKEFKGILMALILLGILNPAEKQ